MTELITRRGIFGGGGAKGFCTIGFLKGARRLGVRIEGTLGVSVGSLVAVLHENGKDADEIHRIFQNRLRKFIINAARNIGPDVKASELLLAAMGWQPTIVTDAFKALGAPGAENVKFDDPRAARDELIEHTSIYPDLLPAMREMVAEFGLKPQPGLRVLAFDLISRRPVIFGHTNTDDLAIALTASCALPGAFRPVAHPDGKMLLVDGAWYHRNPGDFDKPGAIIVKLNKATSLYPSDPLTPLELAGHFREVMGLSAFHRHEVDPSWGHTLVNMVTPHVAGLSFGISTATQDGMVEYGEETAVEVLGEAIANGTI